jgi:restriction system protein
VSDGQQHTRAELIEQLAQEFQLSNEDRTQLLRSGGTRFGNTIDWATIYLRKAGLLQSVGRGRYQLTDRGRSVLASPPAAIDIAFLESRFPEFAEFRITRSRREEADEESPAVFNAANGTWNRRAGVETRIRETMELAIPNEVVRGAALRFFAFVKRFLGGYA